ncbi:DEAD/DEAH box helicase [Bacillaceae bacterium Marseille-Q3522]|nr:DEAD/DEAH box helicase [Bacillaceae bacterium Marseille-Q3522]
MHNSPKISLTQLLNTPKKNFNGDFAYSKDLQKILAGKQLLFDDHIASNEEILRHYDHGYICFRKGIIATGSGLQCLRCGNTDPHFFASFLCERCQKNCIYCRRCIMMGRVSSCSPLISWCGPAPKIQSKNETLYWEGTLSSGQQKASEAVARAIAQNRELLVWAVTGAGKTEVLFNGIGQALQAGKRICIATPRTDVVLELTPRLKKVFPNHQVASLYGGSNDRHTFAEITISTTHQLLRFYHAFDAVIVDEVDAFPYTVEPMLQYAVKQARKPVSAMIYLTATPNERWQRECEAGKRAYVTIPARYHRHPLPVPKFVWCGNWEKNLGKGSLPAIVREWINDHLQIEKQILLFIPQIKYIPKILPILRKLHPAIEAVHAADQERKEKVQRMRDKEILVLVTTTILERGVTFPNIDVAVLGAEDKIFSESALVQISGRAGRSYQYPTGEIVFFHFGKTTAMVNAYRQIRNMNQLAEKMGLID